MISTVTGYGDSHVSFCLVLDCQAQAQGFTVYALRRLGVYHVPFRFFKSFQARHTFFCFFFCFGVAFSQLASDCGVDCGHCGLLFDSSYTVDLHRILQFLTLSIKAINVLSNLEVVHSITGASLSNV